MKTNVLMKIAVVFMAAFGAYAFSGSNANELTTYSRSDTCENIRVACSNSGDFICKVKLINSQDVIDVWDFACMQEIKHYQFEVLPELPN